jgi:signal transduction histidine kinase
MPPVVKVFSRGIGDGDKDRRTGIGDQPQSPISYPLSEKDPTGKQGSFVEIVFEDNGIGFDEQFIGRLFQPFQRLVGRSEFEGSGMGLAICRKIIERHGGEIYAHGEPGQGATIIVKLPVKR